MSLVSLRCVEVLIFYILCSRKQLLIPVFVVLSPIVWCPHQVLKATGSPVYSLILQMNSTFLIRILKKNNIQVVWIWRSKIPKRP
jgi:hypothetical protein